MTWLCSWYCTLHHVILSLNAFTQLKLGLLIEYLPRVAFLPVRYSRLFIWCSVGTEVAELKYTESQTTGSSSQNMFLIVEHKLNSQRKKKKKSWGHDPFSIVWTEFGPAQICGGSSPPWIIPGSGACTTPGLITFTWRREAASHSSQRGLLRRWISQSRPKQRGHMAVWMCGPLVCRHQRVKGEERLSSAALISSNDLLSKSQLLLRRDQRGADHRGLFELRCSSLQPLHRRPGLRLGGWGILVFFIYSIYEHLCRKLQSVTLLSVCTLMLRFFQHNGKQTRKNHSPGWLQYSL